MRTINLGAVYPPAGKVKFMATQLVNGNERRRLKALLTTLQRVQARDGKVTVNPDLGSFKGQLVIDNSVVPGIATGVNKLQARLVALLGATV